MARHISAIALVLTLLAVRPAHADVTYNYIAGASSYTGTSGVTVVSVPIYLQETVTATGTDQTSLIDRVFTQAAFTNAFTGISSVGVAVEQTAQSGATPAQIQGPVVVTPTGEGFSGIQNNAGFTFAPDFQYSGMGSSASVLYQNVNVASTGFNGNNLQVKVALLATNSTIGSVNSQDGETTQSNATYTAGNGATGRYGSGKILIGSLSIKVGSGTTTFQVEPLAASTFQNPSTSTFNGVTNDGTHGTGSGLTTSLSGINTATVLAANVFPTSNSAKILLDSSYTSSSTQIGGNASEDTYNTVNEINPIKGPDAVPASSSFLPFYTANATPFVFTVAAVPEPGSLALCGLIALVGGGFAARRGIAMVSRQAQPSRGQVRNNRCNLSRVDAPGG